MGNKGKHIAHIIDVGGPTDEDGSPDLSDIPLSFTGNFPSDGPPIDVWFARSCERPLKAGTELTSLIPSGRRRY